MMRITNNMMVNDLKRNINVNMLKMDEMQRQLSTNRKINKPSDDPAGIVKALRLRTSLTEGEQYLANISDSMSFMQTTDDAMGSIDEILQKVRELTVKAATGSNNAESNAATAKEIAQLNEQLKLVANSTYGSKYIFSGTNVTETPYQNGDWLGNDEVMEVEIGIGVKIPINLKMKEYFMGRLDQTVMDAGSGIKGITAKNLQEGKYKINTAVLGAVTPSKTSEVQSYLGSVSNSSKTGHFFYYPEAVIPGGTTEIPAAQLGSAKPPALVTDPYANDSSYNASLQLEVKQVKTGVGKGEPSANYAAGTLTFDKPMYLKNWEGKTEAIPTGDLTNHFTYTKSGGSTGSLTAAAYNSATNGVTFTTAGAPTVGDTIVWNNNEVTGNLAAVPPMPGGSKLYGEVTAATADTAAILTPEAYTPVKMVYTSTGWVYDDNASVTADIKGHVYNATNGQYTYVDIKDVKVDMEAVAGGKLFSISRNDLGTPPAYTDFPDDLIIYNSGTQKMGGIDPDNPQIKVGDKTVLSLSAAQTVANSQAVDFQYTYLDKMGQAMPERKSQYVFNTGYFNNNTRELKFITLNEQTGLSYDGSISMVTNVFDTTTAPLNPTSFDYKAGLFAYVDDLVRKVTVGKLPQVGNELAGNDSRLQELLLYRSTVGARINRLELQESRLDGMQESYTKLLTYYEDANTAEVTMNLKMQEAVYQSSLAVGARIIMPTLVDFLS